MALLRQYPAPAAAQEKGRAEDADRKEDQAAVRKRTGEFIKALAGGDAKEIAAFWTSSGEYMRGDDLTIRGRSAIEKAYAEHLKKRPPGTVELLSDSVRFLADDTAVEEGTFLVKRPNPAEQTRSRFTVLYVRVKGQWHFALLREFVQGPSLQELAWLVGAWSFKSEHGDARAVYEWTENKKFLRCNFTISVEGRKATGFQVLALGPATDSIKSWTFESDGGLAEAVWARTEKGWTAKATGVTAEGEKVTATIRLTPTDEDSFTYEAVDRTIDGEKLPDVGPVKVTREKTSQ